MVSDENSIHKGWMLTYCQFDAEDHFGKEQEIGTLYVHYLCIAHDGILETEDWENVLKRI